MTLLYLPLTVVTLVTFLYYYLTRTFNYWKERGITGPQPVPLFGNIKDAALRKKHIGVVFKEIYEAFPDEKIVGVYRMTKPCLLIRDLDIIKEAFIKNSDLFVDRGIQFSEKGLGLNLFHADGEPWRVLRNNFTPLFTSAKLKHMLYLVNERGDNFVKYIDDICNDKLEHNVHQLMQMYTMGNITVCAFGIDVDTHYNQEVIDTLKKMHNLIFRNNFTTELDMMYPGILKMLNASLFPEYVKKFFNSLVKNVVEQRNGTPSNRKDFMDLILELRQKGIAQGPKKNDDDERLTLELTDDIIAAQAFVFYAAGYETSATTLAFTLYLLAKNPDIQEKLIAEIDAVLQTYDGEVTYEALLDMSYMHKVFNETLRLFPPVEPLHRIVAADYKIPGTDLTITKGTKVAMSPIGIHHDEKYYPNPEKFDPERHSAENSKDRHPCAYIPFGIGPRHCIGLRFAEMQSRVCLVKFFSKFRVGVSENTAAKAEQSPLGRVMEPKGGVHLNIIKR